MYVAVRVDRHRGRPVARSSLGRGLPGILSVWVPLPKLKSSRFRGRHASSCHQRLSRSPLACSHDVPFRTAKTQRARREQQTNKTKEEIEQIAERVVDAMLKVHRALGPACWSRRIKRASPMNFVAGISRSAAKLPYPSGMK
jgi:hypothetical protein